MKYVMLNLLSKCAVVRKMSIVIIRDSMNDLKLQFSISRVFDILHVPYVPLFVFPCVLSSLVVKIALFNTLLFIWF